MVIEPLDSRYHFFHEKEERPRVEEGEAAGEVCKELLESRWFIQAKG